MEPPPLPYTLTPTMPDTETHTPRRYLLILSDTAIAAGGIVAHRA